MMIKKWPNIRSSKEKADLRIQKFIFLEFQGQLNGLMKLRRQDYLDMIIKKWPSSRCFEERGRFSNSNFFFGILGSVTQTVETDI